MDLQNLNLNVNLNLNMRNVRQTQNLKVSTTTETSPMARNAKHLFGSQEKKDFSGSNADELTFQRAHEKKIKTNISQLKNEIRMEKKKYVRNQGNSNESSCDKTRIFNCRK